MPELWVFKLRRNKSDIEIEAIGHCERTKIFLTGFLNIRMGKIIDAQRFCQSESEKIVDWREKNCPSAEDPSAREKFSGLGRIRDLPSYPFLRADMPLLSV